LRETQNSLNDVKDKFENMTTQKEQLEEIKQNLENDITTKK